MLNLLQRVAIHDTAFATKLPHGPKIPGKPIAVKFIDPDVMQIKLAGNNKWVEVRGRNYWKYNQTEPLHKLIDTITGNISEFINGNEILIWPSYPEYKQLKTIIEHPTGEISTKRPRISSLQTDGAKLVEQASLGEVFHATDVINLESILQDNRFRLTTSLGTKSEILIDGGKYPYYFSLTRSKIGGYHATSAYDFRVVLDLDYDWLRTHYKILPVNYWGPLRNPTINEMEERLFSKSQYISLPTPITELVKSVHILVARPKYMKLYNTSLKKTLLLAKLKKLPIYVYNKSQDWLLQNTKKAIPLSQFRDYLTLPIDKPRQIRPNKDFDAYLNLYYAPSENKLSTKAKKLLYDIRYHNFNKDIYTRLKADIHNNKTKDVVGKIVPLIKKFGSVEGFIDYLGKKFNKTNTSGIASWDSLEIKQQVENARLERQRNYKRLRYLWKHHNNKLTDKEKEFVKNIGDNLKNNIELYPAQHRWMETLFKKHNVPHNAEAKEASVVPNTVKVGDIKWRLKDGTPRIPHTAFLSIMSCGTFLHLAKADETIDELLADALNEIQHANVSLGNNIPIPTCPHLIMDKVSVFNKSHAFISNSFGQHYAKGLQELYNSDYNMPVRVIIPDTKDENLNLDHINKIRSRLIPEDSDDDIDWEPFDKVYYQGRWYNLSNIALSSLLEIAAKSVDPVSVVAAIKIFVTIIRAYHRFWPTSNINTNIPEWMQEARSFFTKFKIGLRPITNLINMIHNKTDYVDAQGNEKPTVLDQWNENLISIGHDLKKARPAFDKDTSISKNLLGFLAYIWRYLTTKEAESMNRNYKNIQQVIPLLNDTQLTKEWSRIDPTQETDYVKQQQPLATRLKAVVKQLTGRSDDILTNEESSKFTNSTGSIKELYQEYLLLNRQCRTIYINALAEVIRDSGQMSINYEQARQKLANMPISYMPPGFNGNVGYMNKDIQLFSKEGHPLATGAGGKAGLPRRDSTIVMNPDHKPDSDENIWLMRLNSPGIQGQTPYYVRKNVIAARSSKWEDVAYDVQNITTFKHKWEADINADAVTTWLPALMCAILYDAAARIGSIGNRAKGEDTYGMSTVQLNHYKSEGEGFSFTYKGKDGVEQHNEYVPPANISARVNRRLKQLLANKQTTDMVFEYQGIHPDSNRVGAYMHSIGMKGSSHEFRYLKGTEIAERLIKSTKYKIPEGSHTPQRDAEIFFMEHIAKAVGATLGHKTKNQITGRTATKSYISPQLMTDWFENLKLRVPDFVPEL